MIHPLTRQRYNAHSYSLDVKRVGGGARLESGARGLGLPIYFVHSLSILSLAFLNSNWSTSDDIITVKVQYDNIHEHCVL